MEPALPQVPFGRLQCTGRDAVRALLAREPDWARQMPFHQDPVGSQLHQYYRRGRTSPVVEVHWKAVAEGWREDGCAVLPGSRVSLVLSLGDIQPAAVSKLLRMEPTRAFAKGDVLHGSSRVRDHGLWIREVDLPGWHWPEENLAELVAMLRVEPRWQDVLELPGMQRAQVAIAYYGAVESMAGMHLDRELVAELGELGLELDVDLYAC